MKRRYVGCEERSDIYREIKAKANKGWVIVYDTNGKLIQVKNK